MANLILFYRQRGKPKAEYRRAPTQRQKLLFIYRRKNLQTPWVFLTYLDMRVPRPLRGESTEYSAKDP